MRRLLILLAWLGCLLGLLAGAGYWWLQAPLSLSAPRIDVQIAAGSNARNVAQGLVNSGVRTSPTLLYAWFRLSGKSRAMRAGSYEIEQGATPRSVLDKLVRGEQAVRSVTLIEGWTMRQVRTALAQAQALQPATASMQDAEIMDALGRSGAPAEGRFFPDTYVYPKNSRDLEVLRQAMQAMDGHLQKAWQARDPQTPLKNEDELLVLASIVEKETAAQGDRAHIGGVFTNRLRSGMLLQTDPSVIYGMGDAYNGRLRRKDLETDTPWNTYTRAGLPPTPICMPGLASLQAAARPERTRALYFVSRGDGSSHFSESLMEHNRAVNRYIHGHSNTPPAPSVTPSQ